LLLKFNYYSSSARINTAVFAILYVIILEQ